MLILKRKLLEKIAVGPNAEIVIKVLVMSRGQVHIGIEAPKGIPVHRWEVYERIKQILDEDDARLMEPALADLDPEDWEDASGVATRTFSP